MSFCSGLERKREIGARGRDADDALIAALKVKMQRPEAEIMYVNAIMKRSMKRPRIHTSRADGLSSGAFVSMGASEFCLDPPIVLNLGRSRDAVPKNRCEAR